MLENTGLIVKSLCDEKGITVAELERNLGLSNATISRWIKGADPSSSAVGKIADYFHVSVDYLLARTIERGTLEGWNKKYDVEKLAKESKLYDTVAAHLEDKDITDKKLELLKRYMDALFED